MCSTYSSGGVRTLSNLAGKCYLLNGASSYYAVNFPAGRYLIELWGASAGTTKYSASNVGGRGGYVSGVITFKAAKTLYFYVGTKGTDSNYGTRGTGGFNGGANGATDTKNSDCATAGSGGSTDLRISTDKSTRIIVAGGGGSSGCWKYAGLGGHAGGIAGEKGKSNRRESLSGGSGGTQTTGYSLLNGGVGTSGDEAGGSGGGGYYGGYGGSSGAGSDESGSGGGGGSSYISGYQNCKKYTGYIFTNTTMIPGYQQMPNPSNSGYETNGHTGDGYARITKLKNEHYVSCVKKNVVLSISKLLLYIFTEAK